MPSKVAVSNTFGLRAIVFNNAIATITFTNGTCTSPLSIIFNKNVKTEPQATTAACKAQQVTLKPGEQSGILSPNMSGVAYRATAPETTNASMTFKYGFETATNKLLWVVVFRDFSHSLFCLVLKNLLLLVLLLPPRHLLLQSQVH